MRERGLELVRPLGDRPTAPPLAVRTTSFGDGSTFDLAGERGNVVVMYFMAYWCGTCIPEARALAELHERYAAAGVRILVLDVDQQSSERLLAGFRERAGGGRHLWALDRGSTVASSLGVRSLDATVVIDRDGRIAYRDSVPTPRETLVAVLEALR
ncbi:MAG: TlpA family protein disulfide reductase [Candidatus Limnocylindria bacterium]